MLIVNCIFTVEVTPGDLKEFIFNQSVTVNLLELAIVGLPRSGKNELLNHLLEIKTSSTKARCSIEGLEFYEAIVHYNEDHQSYTLTESTKSEAHVHTLATALAQVLARTLKSPSFVDSVSSAQLFDDTGVNEYLHETYTHLKQFVTKLEGEGLMEGLTTTRLTLLNLLNLGVNRAAFEILNILARRCKNAVLLNLLHLGRETPERFSKPLDLSDQTLFGSHYKLRKDDQSMFKLHSAMHYYMQAVVATGGTEQKGNVILVGTHKDELSQGELNERKKYIEQTTMAYAEEVGIADCICPGMECIDAKSDSDCNRLRQRLIELIHHKKQFEIKLPVSHVFFRCYLHTLKKIFISRKQIVKEAMKCGITEEDDIETFLVVFNNCGSIIYSSDGEFPFLKEHVILDPCRFVEALDQLYYVDSTALHDKPGLYEALDYTKYGFVSDNVASELWPGEGEGGMSEADYFLHVLEDLNVIARIDPKQLKSIQEIVPVSQHCFFMPSLRPDFDTSVPKFDSDSLLIVYNVAMIPFHLQSDVIKYLQSQLGDSLTFDPKSYYNTVCFRWRDSEQMCEASISVLFQVEQVEVSVKFLSQKPPMSQVTNLFSTLKTLCIQMLQQLSSQIKGFEYKLAIVCPHSNRSQTKVHYITFHPLSTKQTAFFCEKCNQTIELPRMRLLWTQVAFNGPSKPAYLDGKTDT